MVSKIVLMSLPSVNMIFPVPFFDLTISCDSVFWLLKLISYAITVVFSNCGMYSCV